MLLIKTKTGPSSIEGTGLFANELILRGADVWRFTQGVDAAYTAEALQHLPEDERVRVASLHHAYISKQTCRYILPGDDAKFINHSSVPNLGTRYEEGVEEDINFALHDIKKGEELTLDYGGFAQEGAFFT